MLLAKLRRVVSRRPIAIVATWILIATAVGLAAPSLTRLAAEGQANLLPKDAESVRIQNLVATTWPEQASESMAVVALLRQGKLTAEDEGYARRLAEAFEGRVRPKEILRVMGPQSAPEVASRLLSPDGTMRLVVVPMSQSFVSPSTHRAVAWLQEQAARLDGGRPSGLQELWSGDAVIGRDYMNNVQQSLDRAALATVALLLGVLLVVYRSLLVAIVPLFTIGISLVISRAVLAWLTLAGWDVSPLVELFLVVVLFGSGTDFCLFLAWRFGEHWDPDDPSAAMEATLASSTRALLTSAGTVIAGLSLMGTTRFKLFSSTGPSVALGLALTVVAALTLAPALLVLLARHRPRSFGGLTRPSGQYWEKLGHAALKRPLLTWLATLAVMVPPALLGLRTEYTQDTLTEMPPQTASVQALRQVAAKFGEGFLAPLTIVLEAKTPKADLRQSEGRARGDEPSRFLSESGRLEEVRSAAQPLGSPALLAPARIGARLGEVNKGCGRMAEGATQLHDGLLKGVAQIRLTEMLKSAVKG